MSQLFEVVDSVKGDGTEFQVLQYEPLQNSHLHVHQKIGNRVHQVRVLLNDGKIISETDAFYFLRGQIEIDHKMKNANLKLKKLASSMVKNEAMLKPTYEGTGEVYFKPGLLNYIIYRLQDEEIIVDPNMFVCAEATIQIGLTQTKKLPVAASKFADKFIQTVLSGSGIVVLKSFVPSSELLEIELHNDRFQTDENLVVFRSGDIEFTVESAAKSVLSSFTSSEAFLRTYTGTGKLWIAPTQPFYNKKE